MKLLKELIEIASPSGSEFAMKDFILNYVKTHQKRWRKQPEIVEGETFHDNLILVFGTPRTAVFAHMDTTGFTVRYQDQLVPIGSPDAETGYELVGEDHLGPIQCKLRVDEEGRAFYDFARSIAPGTTLTWKPYLKMAKGMIQGPYLDNRLGLYNALKLAETLDNGVIVFSTYEEHGGGSVPLLIKYLCENHPVRQALISDITWVTEGVRHGGGVALSLRDRHIPRRRFINRLRQLAAESGVPYQLEVEGNGSSDGREVHFSPYPVDWCFIGAPEANVHSPRESVQASDLEAMLAMYRYLMEKL